MLSNARIEKLALFFYFMFLDEVKAQTATMRTIRRLRGSKGEGKDDENIVRVTHQEALKAFKTARATGLTVSSGHIIIPENSDWGPWFEFRKVADLKDFEAVLYHNVIGLPLEDIAKGLNIPE